MTTKEAFKQLITTRSIYKVLEVNRATVSRWKSGKDNITIDKMEELLKKAGWEKEPEKWRKLPPNNHH